MNNVDPEEIKKFSKLAENWWNPNSQFKPLHDINPLRFTYINERYPVADKNILDVGCGGGLLCEEIARNGGRVKGIDLSEKAITVAKIHLQESKLDVSYELSSAEALVATESGQYDVVTCLEMLEHTPDPLSTVVACSKLVTEGGVVIFSTINRNPKSYLFAIIGAEYVLKLLPIGTHSYEKFIRPSELTDYCLSAGLNLEHLIGMTYNPIVKKYSLNRDTSVNYILAARKP
ncbi:MAG: bifunctional 3-demethylubiquinol 3-O-methyltransferase/2-polyprenyl-6-hydroxyphenol methylase [Proteobacteria bacterium]|nr:bifunctional 3-demethylubiquinol 3-O-methyltransferase/2-polyprenyl-6-hydroxyphenol methylase [Pseudomonadota bacterium]